FLLSPPLNYRFMGHYSLSNQWLLLAAILVFFSPQQAQLRRLSGAPMRAQQESSNAARRFVISAVVLTAVAVGINPYIAFQVLLVLTAAVVSLLWQRRLTLPRAAAMMVLLCGTGFATA